MSWTKREVQGNLVVLGDEDGTVKTAGGLLARLIQNTRFPGKIDYEVILKNGDAVTLAGSASLNNQLFPADVGKFFKAEFLGWGTSARGQFKKIEVVVWDGEPTDTMKAWPRYGEFTKNGQVKAAEERSIKQVIADEFADESADDLPF